MTARLYYSDSYLVEFDATVVDAGDDGRRVYLDQTAFYPTSGGQPFDTGAIAGAQVVDVIDEGDRIAHVLGAPLAAAGRVSARVDWARRFDHMQQHTGQHILSAVFGDVFGHATSSVHFGADSSSLDLDVESVSRDKVVEAERRANEIVFQNRAVSVSYEEAASAAALRKASDREGALRIVTIHGVDRSACGGTHVRATGEVGPILLRKHERVRKTARIEFLCGARAVRRARADFEALSGVAQSLSGSIDEVPALVSGMAEQLRAAESHRKRTEGELASYRARDLRDAAAPDVSGVRRVVERRDAGSLDQLRSLAHALAALPRTVFVGSVADPPALITSASEDSGVDAGAMLKATLATLGGRGGGSARVAQGSVPTREALERAIEALSRPSS